MRTNITEKLLKISDGLWYSESPAHGYKLAADYCQHYDSRYGNGLIGPGRRKIEEMARFVYKLEEMQETRR